MNPDMVPEEAEILKSDHSRAVRLPPTKPAQRRKLTKDEVQL